MAAPTPANTNAYVAKWPTRANWAIRIPAMLVSFAIPVFCTFLLNARATAIREQSEAGLAENVAQAVRVQDQAKVHLKDVSSDGTVVYHFPSYAGQVTGTMVAYANHCLQSEQAVCSGDIRITRHVAEEILFVLSPETERNPGLSDEYAIAQQDLADATSMVIAAERRLAQGAPPEPIPGTLEKATLLVWFAFAGFLTWLWLYRNDVTIQLNPHKVQLGKTVIAATQIVGCRVVENRLEVRLLGCSTYLSPPFSVSNAQLQALATRIQTMALTRDERLEEARARLEVERLHQEMSRHIER